MILRGILVFIVLATLMAAAIGLYSFHRYRSPSVLADTTVTIARGTGVRAMLAQLHAAGVLPAPWTVMLPVALGGEYRSFKAGEYAFMAGASPQEVVAQIARGAVVVHAVTIPEGWNVAQVRAALLAEPLLSGTLPASIAEGSVAPDTVHFQRGDDRAALLARMQQAQQQALQNEWQARAEGLPLATPEEALVLASIVEAETGVADERPRVAAVYINRLRLSMALQADPTVAYGVAPAGMKRPLSRADLKRPTPYNTYVHAGLPPGPICNPGRASIAAVMHPLATDELYFVATGTGGHWFAATVAEHNANVARYRAVVRGQ
jgi:UPF0755 protein